MGPCRAFLCWRSEGHQTFQEDGPGGLRDEESGMEMPSLCLGFRKADSRHLVSVVPHTGGGG